MTKPTNRIAGAMLVAAVAALAVVGCSAVSGVGNGISAFGNSISNASTAARDGRDRPLAYDPAACLPDANGKQPAAICKTQKVKTVKAVARTKSARATPARTAATKPVAAQPAAQPAAAKPIPVKATTAKPVAKAKARPAAQRVKSTRRTTVKDHSIAYDPASCLPDANGRPPTALCRDQDPTPAKAKRRAKAKPVKSHPVGYDPASCLPDANGKQPSALCEDQALEKAATVGTKLK